MTMITRLLRQVNILNILLFVLIIAFTLYGYRAYRKSNRGVNIETGQTQHTPEQPLSIATKHKLASKGDYILITEKNLFHPDRKFVKQEAPKAQAAEVPPPEIVVYGTLVTDAMRAAYVVDKKDAFTTPGRGARQRTVHVGDTLAGYTVKNIIPDQVELASGERLVSLRVIEGTKNKERKPVPLKPKKSGDKPGAKGEGGQQNELVEGVKKLLDAQKTQQNPNPEPPAQPAPAAPAVPPPAAQPPAPPLPR